MISVGHFKIDNNELRPPMFLQLDISFPKIGEEVHDANHSLRVWLLVFRGGDYRLAIDDEVQQVPSWRSPERREDGFSIGLTYTGTTLRVGRVVLSTHPQTMASMPMLPTQ